MKIAFFGNIRDVFQMGIVMDRLMYVFIGKVKIKVFNSKGGLIKTIYRCLRPGGTDRKWYVYYTHKLVEVFGDSMDNVPNEYTTDRYIVIE